MLRLLPGLPKGLEGRAAVWLFCDGLRPNGLCLSGEREPALVGDVLESLEGLAGVGVLARPVEDALLFWRLKGDWRPESGVKGRRDCILLVSTIIPTSFYAHIPCLWCQFSGNEVLDPVHNVVYKHAGSGSNGGFRQDPRRFAGTVRQR